MAKLSRSKNEYPSGNWRILSGRTNEYFIDLCVDPACRTLLQEGRGPERSRDGFEEAVQACVKSVLI